MSGRSLHRPACPFCGSQETELLSLFGQQLLTSQYYCNACRTPFERVKDAGVIADGEVRASETDRR